jgi:hypothetical protein
MPVVFRIFLCCCFFVSLAHAQGFSETDLAGIREELIENRKKLLDAQEKQIEELFQKLNVKKNFLAHLGELMQHYGAKFTDTIIYVDVSMQQLYLVHGYDMLKTYPVSTSKYGSGFQAGSFQTPLGVHKIKGKYGDGEKPGTIFEERIPTKKIAKIFTDSTDVSTDLIITRILWLDGLENNVNKGNSRDTYERYIYIHGTHEEGLIGQPTSMGCVRMKNEDIIKLFNEVREGTFVVIVAKLHN